MKKLIAFSILLIIICCKPTFSQPNNPVFHTYGTENGMPQNTITTIHQGPYGFMWFGTQDGLARFDGYEFKTFRHDPRNPNSLGSNFIWDIHEDDNGDFWISSFGGGLTRFNLPSETFIHFKRDPQNENSLSHNNTFTSVSTQDHVWVGTNDGLCKVNPTTGFVESFLQVEGSGTGQATNYIGKVAFQKPDLLWVSTEECLIRFNINTGAEDLFYTAPFGEPIPLTNVRDIQIEGEKVRLITSTHFMELDFNLQTQNLWLFLGDLKDNPGFTTFLKAQRNSWWIGSGNGLILLNPQTGEHRIFRNDKNDPNSLPSNSIHSMARSKDGVLWIGTQQGLAKLERENSGIHSLPRLADATRLSSNHIRGIVEDDQQILWIATTNGLNAFERRTGAIHAFHFSELNSNSLSSDYILSLCLDDHNQLWVGTRRSGLNKISLDTGKPLHSINFERMGPGNSTIHSILNEGKLLWIGTGGNGLIHIDTETEEIRHYPMNADGTGPNHPYVYHILKDSFDNYWLATPTGGLNLFSPLDGRFLYIQKSDDNPNSLVNDLVLCVFEDSKNQIWVGTASGLSKLKIPLERNLFDKLSRYENLAASDLFENFGRDNGLPNEVIYGILEDDRGKLWITTNEGLVKFDAGKEQVEKVFTKGDGLPDNEHNQNAYFKNNRGELFFGGTNGLYFFHPDSLKTNPFEPVVQITDFLLYNEPVTLQNQNTEDNFALEQAPFSTNAIKLKHHQKVITFRFSALSYINTEKTNMLTNWKDLTMTGYPQSKTGWLPIPISIRGIMHLK